MKFKKQSLLALLLVGAITMASGCSSIKEVDGSAEAEVSPKSVFEKPVVKLAGGDTGTPNPYLHQTRGPGMSKMQLLYDSLLEIDENGYIPWLASSYSVDESGKVYTFELVKNAFWHDGQPLSVEDVLFTFDYADKNKPVSDTLTVAGKSIVEEIEKTGDYSFSITVSEASNTALASIGGVRILPKHIWQSVEDPLSFTGEGATVGSGPFKLEHYDAVKGEYRYVAFDQYWGLEPAVAAIEWVPVSDSVLAFENQEIDLINVAADLVGKYKSDASYTVEELPSYHAYRLMMNLEMVESLRDVEVRQALAHAIDRQALVDKIARGNAEISGMGYIPSTSKWYNPNVADYALDVEKSKALLEGKNLEFKMLIGNTPVEAKMAELIQLDLQKVGVTVDIKSVESKTRDEALKSGKYELLLINSGGMGSDPDYMRSIYGALNDAGKPVYSTTIKGYENQSVFELAHQQAYELDETKRATLLNELQLEVSKDVPMIMLISMKDNFVYRQDYYDGWYARFDHSKLDHNKLSYLMRK